MFVGRSVRIPVNNARDSLGYFPGINYAGQVYAAERSSSEDAPVLDFLTPKVFFYETQLVNQSPFINKNEMPKDSSK